LAVNENETELQKDIKISLTIRLYRLEKWTIGKAPQLSGLSRYDFMTLLSEHNISGIRVIIL
jgi:predicted HTH domain antitoxin